jgi:hypothetical protein
MTELRNWELEKEISNRLENLVQNRFTKESLESLLSIIFDVSIVLEDISHDEDELGDYNFLGHFDIPDKNLYGYFDIYFLKMRRPGFDGSDLYVTEVAIQFE